MSNVTITRLRKTPRFALTMPDASIGFFPKPKAEPELPKSQSWENAGKPKGKGKASLNQQFKVNTSICMMCFSPWLYINKWCWHLLNISFSGPQLFRRRLESPKQIQTPSLPGLTIQKQCKPSQLVYSMYAIVIRFLQVLHFLQSIDWVQHAVHSRSVKSSISFSILCKKTR